MQLFVQEPNNGEERKRTSHRITLHHSAATSEWGQTPGIVRKGARLERSLGCG
jgi:hypothetical protein